MSFTLVHAGKYRTEDKLKIQTMQKQKIQKPNTTPQKQTTQNTAKQNYPGLVAARKRAGIILPTHMGLNFGMYSCRRNSYTMAMFQQ